MKSIHLFFIFCEKIVNPTKILTFAVDEKMEND